MKQMDRLMEEESYLNKELTLIGMELEESQIDREDLIETENNPFEVMKTVWKSGGEKYDSAIEHAESLNYTIGSIKMSVRRIVQMEKENSSDFTQ